MRQKDPVRRLLPVTVALVALGLAGCASSPPEQAPAPKPSYTAAKPRAERSAEITGVWTHPTSPCAGNGPRALARHSRESAIVRTRTVPLANTGIRYRIPLIERPGGLSVKLFFNDTSQGRTDHYLLLADKPSNPPFGAVRVTQLADPPADVEAVFAAVRRRQRRLAGNAYGSIVQREYPSRFGKTLEMIVPDRVGTLCFPTGSYRFMPPGLKMETLGVSRYILHEHRLIELTLIVPIPYDYSGSRAHRYARNLMDTYMEGLSP